MTSLIFCRNSPRPCPAGLDVVDPIQNPHWDDQLLALAGCSVFHSTGWAEVLSSTYSHKPAYLLNSQAGRLNALLPLMEVSSKVSGRRGVSLPFTDFCDPLLGAETAFDEVFQAAIALGKSRQWKYLEVRIGSEIGAFKQPSLEFFGHAIDLKRPEAAIFSSINSTLRNEIRKAERSGVEVVLATDPNAMKLYYELHCLTRRKHGLPPQPFSFFSNIHAHLVSKGFGFVALAFQKPRADAAGETKSNAPVPDAGPPRLFRGDCRQALQNQHPIAGGVFLNFGRRAVYKFGASDESQTKVPAGKLALWRAIQYYQSQQLEILEMGRTSIENAGLRRYKQAWGAAERRIRNFKYDLIHDRMLAERDKVYGWYNRFFTLCPPGLSRLIGAWLYPHLD